MYEGCKIKAPFFEIGPKSYLYGDDVLELALAADAAAEKYDVDISLPRRTPRSAVWQRPPSASTSLLPTWIPSTPAAVWQMSWQRASRLPAQRA